MESRPNASGEPFQDGPQLLGLLVDVVTGTIVFVVIALAAVGLSFLVDWLACLGINQWIIIGLRFAEYLLFTVDLVLFTVFVLRTAWRNLRNQLGWK